MGEDFRQLPIPTPKSIATTSGYRHIALNLEDARAQEPLVDVSERGIANNSYYARKDGQNAPYYRSFTAALSHVFLRAGTADRLHLANSFLSPYGAELLAWDGYRPIALQKQLWQYFIDEAERVLSSPTEKACAEFAEKYCSDPRTFDPEQSTTWPTHCTGGAVDLTLRSLATGSELFMGSIFDDASEVSRTCNFEHIERPNASELEARNNRRLLYWAMQKAGFVNYPYEWWHFDYLTQMWSMNSENSQTAPCYGPASLDY